MEKYENSSKNFESFQKAKQKKRRTRVIIVSICLFAGFGGGMLGSYIYNFFVGSNNFGVTTSQINSSTTLSSEDTVSLVANSVVDVSSEINTSGAQNKSIVNTSVGSGVIYSSNGYIVTNEHIIKNSNGKIIVTLKSGTSYPANLVGSDPNVDVALLKIEATNLSPAVFADSTAVKLGEETIVIGNPLGELSGTVTDGVISAIDRGVTIDGREMTLMQTCAEINSGNSGGGMFRRTGELVGLVIAKSSGDDVEGLGFAIPSNTVKNAVEKLLKK